MSEGPEGNGANGKKIFIRNCQNCHSVAAGGKHAIGPNLQSVWGRKIATIKGFKFSAALGGHKGENWGAENLNQWLENPGGFAAGNSMAFAGVKSEAERKDLIRFLYESHPKNKAK
ncbi:unnamed protein product [Blepharisma stoltei]|uniref:Cytochrome c domain-containing protein n=1 Tax=Blepharisma stoltei TaxID=1481888 RepID=A0AAU9J447_9CILI|nr:unnamed protein product [Blepharisma stoltei]